MERAISSKSVAAANTVGGLVLVPEAAAMESVPQQRAAATPSAPSLKPAATIYSAARLLRLAAAIIAVQPLRHAATASAVLPVRSVAVASVVPRVRSVADPTSTNAATAVSFSRQFAQLTRCAAPEAIATRKANALRLFHQRLPRP